MNGKTIRCKASGILICVIKREKNATPSEQFHNHRNRGSIDTPNIHVYDYSLSWLGTCTSLKRGGVK